MIFLKAIFDLYIKGSIHVAVSVASFTAITYFHLGISIGADIVLFTFFCTVIGYNYIKYSEIILKNPTEISAYLKIILSTTVVSIIGLGFYLPSFEWAELLLITALAMLSFFYSHPFLNRFQNLRSITGLKILIIAFVWTGFTVLLPGLSEELIYDHTLWLESIQRFFVVIILTLPFDLRDLRTDAEEIKTIPQMIGIKNTKYLSTVLVILIIGIEIIFPYKQAGSSALFISIALLLLFITLKTPLFQSRYYASFWIEGIPIVWFTMLYLFL